jgi:hypothetical protein
VASPDVGVTDPREGWG